MDTDANIVVIGAGIVGASVAHHLVEMGIEGVVVLDKGDLDHNDGSTSHAPGGLRTLTRSHFLTTLGIASRAVYDSLPLAVPGKEQFYRTGSAQVANTAERFDSHKRLHEMGLSHDIDSRLMSPSEVAELLPLVDPKTVYGGIHIPSAGVVNTSLLATSMRQIAEATGRARFYGETEVIDFDIRNGRIGGVITNGELGTIGCNQAVVCTNIWAPLLAEKAGAAMPLYPGEHQYIYTKPVPALGERALTEVTMPVTAFDDLSIYFRQHGDHIGIGSYAHQARLVDPRDLPKTAMLPFTPDDFTEAWEKMQHHMPGLRETEVDHGFNGMFAFTVDGLPVLGETPVAGLWSAVGAWLSFASEVGRVMARWMTTGDPGMDVSAAHIDRFHPYQSNREYLSRQAKYFYEIGFEDLHPSAVASSVRNLRHAPYHQRLEALGAEYVPFAAQETPLYYRSNADLVDKYRHAIAERTGYHAIGWSPIMGAEHLEMRSNVGIVDWSSMIGPIEISGPGALEHLQYLCTADVDIPIGQLTYSLVLTASGGVTRDITVARIAQDRWWILTGKANMPLEMAIFESLAPNDGSVRYQSRSEELVGIGIWGPNSRAVLEKVTTNDLSNEAFPWYRWQAIDVGMAPTTAIRISYVGELGWEIYVARSLALHVWDTLWDAGREFDMPAVGTKSLLSMRIEKGYGLWGSDMTPEYPPAASRMSWTLDTSKDFHGREAALAAKISRKVVTLRFAGDDAVVYGWEPVLVGDNLIGFVAGGEYGYNVGAFLAHAFLDVDHTAPGTEVDVQFTGVRYRATVVTSPPFDPDNARLRA